jgi:hypothetical protein
LVRGDWDQKGVEVGARGLSVISGTGAPQLASDVATPRTHLANWMTSDASMVTARVYVNRLWQNYFGRGIVSTPNNFGKNGQRPSHPELLDALAASFIEGGWRTKPLIRTILLSSAYRQASRSPMQEVASELDPENRLLWKFNRRRLSAEEIRDAMLAVSGRLNCQAGGPSVIVPVQKELVQLLYHPEQWEVTPDSAEHDRRSIYLISKRNLRLPFMEVFDQPIAQISCAARQTTTHAPQVLELLNGQFTNDVAKSFAHTLRQECGPDVHHQIDRAFLLAAGRIASKQERELSARFLRENSLDEFALALLNTNEFLYVD